MNSAENIALSFVMRVNILCILSKNLGLLYKAATGGKNKSRNGGLHPPRQFHKSKEQNHVEKMERI